MGENKPMKKTTSEQPQTRKPYKLTRAAKMQRRDAALKSAKARRTNDKWRSAAVTESLYEFAVTKYGSVNEALRHLKRNGRGA